MRVVTRRAFARGFGNLVGNLIPYSRAGKQLRNAFHIAKSVRLPTTWQGDSTFRRETRRTVCGKPFNVCTVVIIFQGVCVNE
jgi:hypothetical protein